MASNGTILVQVYTSRAQIPVAGATVALTQKGEGGRHRLLAVRITDENGRTAPVEIAAPDSGAGLAPGTAVPFALADIWVQSPGYELFLAEDVQIFPDTQTLQEVMLIPLPEQAPASAMGELVRIPPQDL